MEMGLERLGLLLHDASRAMRKCFDERARALGLSSAQWRLLVNVLREGQATQARLAELLEIEPISVSRLLDRMEALDWVKREAHPTDRRVRVVVPTDKAQTTVAEIRAMAAEVYAEALVGLSDPQREALVVGLNTIIRNLSGAEGLALRHTCSEAKK